MTKTARQLKGREIKEQFTDARGRIWSLQARAFSGGLHGKIVVEFHARGVKGGAARWQMQLMASGPMTWALGVWEEYKADAKPGIVAQATL